jgi:hypothetical protein
MDADTALDVERLVSLKNRLNSDPDAVIEVLHVLLDHLIAEKKAVEAWGDHPPIEDMEE